MGCPALTSSASEKSPLQWSSSAYSTKQWWGKMKMLQKIYLLVEVQNFNIWQTCVHYLLPTCVEKQRRKCLIFSLLLGGEEEC